MLGIISLEHGARHASAEQDSFLLLGMTKKKYYKSTPNLCKARLCRKKQQCHCLIQGHRKWMGKKYYGWVS